MTPPERSAANLEKAEGRMTAKDTGIRMSFSEELQPAKIKVIGVGGGGCNAINRMIRAKVEGVEFITANTDLQALKLSQAPTKLQLGAKLTKGLGAGANPEVGRKAALEDTDKIIEALEGSDMIFITSGLGGGTGSGAAPVVASLASELGALSVAVVTKPFAFEGKRRMLQAEQALQELIGCVDTVIVIPNERLMDTVERGTSFFDAFRIADDILRQAVQGISDIITVPGIINRDFADVKAIMHGQGYAVMGTAIATGTNRAIDAANRAISSPLLEDNSIQGAQGILINISGSSSLTLHEVHEASSVIQKAAHENANIIFGAVMDDSMKDAVKITVIAAGFKEANKKNVAAKATVPPQDLESRPRSRSSRPAAANAAQRSPSSPTKRPRSKPRSPRGRPGRADIPPPPSPKSLSGFAFPCRGAIHRRPSFFLSFSCLSFPRLFFRPVAKSFSIAPSNFNRIAQSVHHSPHFRFKRPNIAPWHPPPPNSTPHETHAPQSSQPPLEYFPQCSPLPGITDQPLARDSNQLPEHFQRLRCRPLSARGQQPRRSRS